MTRQRDIIDIPARPDARGDICVIETAELVGCAVHRVFYYRVKDHTMPRGGHAHKALVEFIVCLQGSVRADIEDVDGKRSHMLDSERKGLLLNPGTWIDLGDIAPDTILMVLASAPYDEADYIRNYTDFKAFIAPGSDTPVEYVPMKRMVADNRAEIESAIGTLLDGAQFIGGAALDIFERDFSAFCDVRHVVGCGNGLEALALILQAMDIGPGDEVILPANTFIATALAVTYAGAVPVLVDCTSQTYGIDAGKLRAAITDKTRAIIPVHLYGIPADMDAISQVAMDYDLKIIEDAAQAHGAVYKGRRAGGLGHAAAFSFYPTKNLGALGDGGAVATNDADLAQRLRKIANYGSGKRYHHDILGRNSRLDPLQAAILSARLKKLDDENDRRAKLADIYFESFSGHGDITLPGIPDHITPVWHIFPVLVPAQKRDGLIAHLSDRHIQALVHYPVPVHLQQCYAGQFDGQAFPVTEDSTARLISLPLTPWHTEDEIHRVADAILEFMEDA